MIDPPGQLDDVVVMADWVELSAATTDPPELDRTSVGETLDAAGLMGMQDGGLPPGDMNWIDDDVFNPEDESDRYTELVWDVLRSRSIELGDAYPYVIDGLSIGLREVEWSVTPAYVFLLLMDHGRCYAGVNVGMASDSPQSRLFEKLVEAAAPGIFFGKSQRFGWPREPDWPTGIVDRIMRFAELLELIAEGNLDQKTTAADSDKGLDVAASLGLGFGEDSTAWFLIQCACGQNWKGKVGEPSIGDWQDILMWKGELVRGLALPWRLNEPWDIHRTGRKFDAVVLERDRLARGHPDSRLRDPSRGEIIEWCSNVIEQLPYVEPHGIEA